MAENKQQKHFQNKLFIICIIITIYNYYYYLLYQGFDKSAIFCNLSNNSGQETLWHLCDKESAINDQVYIKVSLERRHYQSV